VRSVAHRNFLQIPCLAVLLLAATVASAQAGDALKTIDNPGGGQVVYGALASQSTLQGAMGVMLRNVHTHFGDRPQVGKIFEAKGSESVAALFTVTARTQGNKPIAGLVIVSMTKGSKPTAAVLYDDAARFPKSEPVLMKKLNDAWQSSSTNASAAAKPAGSAPTGQGTPQPLRQTPFPDNSGSIGLPVGWRITGAHAGVVDTSGPNGELVNIGTAFYPIYDPRSPQVQARLRYNTGQPILLCSYGSDPVSAFTCVIGQSRQNKHLPPASIHITSTQQIPRNPNEAQAVLVIADLDVHDGKGLSTASLRIGISPERAGGVWSMGLSEASAPKQMADAEWATLKAIYASYRINGQVIGKETQQTIADIHAIGAASARQAANAHAAEDTQAASFNAHMDSIDRNSKAFQLYQLDQTQVQDNQNNTRGTLSNGAANLLIGSDPNRFQSVPTQDFIKGVDY
jgi:hypothetical protein